MNPLESIIEGTLHPDGTLVLDEAPNLPPGRVKVVMRENVSDKALSPEFFQMMEEILAAQQSRGHVPQSADALETERRNLRSSMEDEIDEAIRLQKECGSGRNGLNGGTPQP